LAPPVTGGNTGANAGFIKKAWLTPASPRAGELVRANERVDDVAAGDHADQPTEPDHGQNPPRQPDEQPGNLLDRQLLRRGDQLRVMTSATTWRQASCRYAAGTVRDKAERPS